LKILVFSDTHRQTDKMLIEIKKHSFDTDLCIHLGDNIQDTLDIRNNFSLLPLISVPGNCDFDTSSIFQEEKEKLITLELKKVLILHGHSRNVQSDLQNAFYAGKFKKADLVLFGHTHVPYLEVTDGITVFNPGSISRPRGGSTASYGIVHIGATGITCNHIEVEE